jgi:hypothetical protein
MKRIAACSYESSATPTTLPFPSCVQALTVECFRLREIVFKVTCELSSHRSGGHSRTHMLTCMRHKSDPGEVG